MRKGRQPSVIKIGSLHRGRADDDAAPYIRLSGKWVEAAGFKCDATVRVVVADGEVWLVAAPSKCREAASKQLLLFK
jgi:hypothetical protein